MFWFLWTDKHFGFSSRECNSDAEGLVAVPEIILYPSIWRPTGLIDRSNIYRAQLRQRAACYLDLSARSIVERWRPRTLYEVTVAFTTGDETAASVCDRSGGCGSGRREASCRSAECVRCFYV